MSEISPLVAALAVVSAALLVWVLARREVARLAAEGREAATRADMAARDVTHRDERLAEAEASRAELAARLDRAEEDRRALAASEAGLTRSLAERDRAREEARERHRAAEEALREASAEVSRLAAANEGMRAEAEARSQAHEKEVALVKALRDEMTDRFKALADETLRTQGDSFAKANHERLSALLAPMKEHVGRFQEELRTAHEGAAKDRERLKTEIEHLTRRSEQVSQEAVALTRALKGENRRQGAWGEMILERLLEDSGLEEGTHYDRQAHRRDGDGRAWRPDVVVRMPREKCLVIDAKVSLTAYEAAVNADGDERRERLRAHVTSVRRHIDDLAARGYHALAQGSVDYVLMFLPIEGALSAALAEQGDLTSYALRKGVGVMTPTTLMVALRTVEHVWAVERRESNAEAIADRAGKLYDKMRLFVEAMDDVGRHLDLAREAHGTAMDRLTRGHGNLVGQAEKLRKLGARTGKAMEVEFDEDRDPPAIAAAE